MDAVARRRRGAVRRGRVGGRGGADRSARRVRGHHGALQVRVDRQRAGRLAAARRSAACCRRTGCSRRCRRSAATSCRAATRRVGFIVEPGHDLPIGVSRRRRLGIDQVGLQLRGLPHRHRPRHARRGAARRARHAGAAARSAGVRAVRARLHARQPDDGRERAAGGSRRWASGPSLFERLLLRVGLIDRLKMQTLDAAEPHRADPRRRRAAVGPWPRGHVQPLQGDSVQLASRPGCRRPS